MKNGTQPSDAKFLMLTLLGAALGSFVLVSCAEDTAKISLTLAPDNAALTVIQDAQNDGDRLTVRMMYTYPGRVQNGQQVVSVRPTTAVPVNALESPKWETAVEAGYDFTAGSFDLDAIPFGNRDTVIVFEVLRLGAENYWYAIAYGCIISEFAGEELTPDLFKSLNGSSVPLTKGRACGGCSDPRTYTVYDVDECP